MNKVKAIILAAVLCVPCVLGGCEQEIKDAVNGIGERTANRIINEYANEIKTKFSFEGSAPDSTQPANDSTQPITVTPVSSEKTAE